MRNRMIAAAAALIVAVGGVMFALNAPAATAAEHEIVAAGAGTVLVTVDGSTVTIADVVAADGWMPEVEAVEGREVEMDFRKGELRVQVNAEIEDGELRIRVRERNGSEEIAEIESSIPLADVATTGTTVPDNEDDDSTTSTTVPDSEDDDSTTSTTVPDEDDDDLDSGSDDDDDDPDSSGPGSDGGEDENEEEDDDDN